MRFISTVIASIIGGLIAITLFVMFALTILAGLAATDTGAPVIKNGSVLTVRIRGQIPELSETAPIQFIVRDRSSVTLRQVTRAIRYAADDDRIEGLWIIPEHLSGSWAALEEIRASVVAFRESGKPTIASSTADGFSEKDYFVASAAENVFSPSQAAFEFNGFVIVAQFMKHLLDKIGVEVESVRAGRFKSAVEPFTRDNASDENREELQALVDSQAETFLSAIADSRGLPFETLDGMVQSASIIDAEGAFDARLLDRLLTEDEVRDLVLDSLVVTENEPELVNLTDYAATVPAVVSGTSPKGTIAVLYAVGTIVEGSGGYDPEPFFGGKQVGSTDLVNALRDLREDDRVKAVVLRVDSPGGSGLASDVVWQAVRQTADVKPVVASMGGLAASGGYYIAVGADSIVADASTITGSIGVFSLLINSSGLLEDKLGITSEAMKTAPTADMYSGLRKLTSFERQILERGVDRTYDRFTQVVAESRGLQINDVLSLAQGRVWTGSQAALNGLVDEVGTLDSAIEMAASIADLDSTGYRIAVYPKEKSLFERLWQMASSAEAQISTNLFENSLSGAAVRQIRLLHEIEHLHGTVQARMPVYFSID
jgi:protease-4